MDSPLQAWQWVLIALGICLFVIINAFTIYMIKKRKQKKLMKEGTDDEEKNQPSPASTTIEEDVTIDEGFMASKEEKDTYSGGQQFVVLTPDQTGLSPPRRERKESGSSSLSKVVMEEEDHQRHIRSVFSLSPLHEHSNQTTPASGSHNEFSSISSDMARTSTPFQGHTPISNHQFWRGPTPPWTQQQQQHTPHSTSSATS